ncbi:hypothetical protein VR46_43325, partial [Streptomyces sp. NRRL S-444]
MNEELARQLRTAAEAHQPDRARILARVERGMAGAPARRRQSPGARPWRGVALASLATAGVLAVGGFAVAAIVQSPPARPDVSATPAAPPASPAPSAPSASGTPRSTPLAPTTGGSTAPGHSSPTSPGPAASGGAGSAGPGGARVQDGPLRSAGSLAANSDPYWAQSDITLKTTEQLTALTVELRIAQTGGVQST